MRRVRVQVAREHGDAVQAGHHRADQLRRLGRLHRREPLDLQVRGDEVG